MDDVHQGVDSGLNMSQTWRKDQDNRNHNRAQIKEPASRDGSSPARYGCCCTWQTGRGQEGVLWLESMELPEVVHQLNDEVTAHTVR